MTMYALIASDSFALRSAASILLPSIDPDITLQFASNIQEIETCLLTGRVKSAAIDPNLPGYGNHFDIEQLARQFPFVRFSTLSPVPNRQPMFESFEAALALAAQRSIPMPAADTARQAPLTARQNDVLHLLREGRSTKEIARRLDLAVPTVKTHLAALYRQLGARNRVEAVMKAVTPPAAHPRGGMIEARMRQRAALTTA